MARWYGKIGFAITSETKPGVWTSTITARSYYGEIRSNTRRWQTSQQVNDDLVINNQISIIADPFANTNLGAMRYVEFKGSYWNISDVTVQYPRLLLSIGSVYTGETADE